MNEDFMPELQRRGHLLDYRIDGIVKRLAELEKRIEDLEIELDEWKESEEEEHDT